MRKREIIDISITEKSLLERWNEITAKFIINNYDFAKVYLKFKERIEEQSIMNQIKRMFKD